MEKEAKKRKYELINISPEYKPELDTLCKESGISTYKECTESMIFYFRSTGINPKDAGTSLIEEMKKVRGELKEAKNTYIGFIRKMEQDKIDPLNKNLNDYFEVAKDFYNNKLSTKNDVQEILKAIHSSKTLTMDYIPERNISETPLKDKETIPPERTEQDTIDIKRKIERAKKLAHEFTDKFKKSTFNNTTMTIDITTVKVFLDQVNRL